MKYKIAPNFFFIIIAVIIGGALFKQFDFQNFKFEKPALAVVYIITLLICIGLIIKKSKNE
jgi:predicted ferric reductase